MLGVLIVPCKLLDLYQGWLISYSGLLGAVGGVIVCDYVLVRRFRLDVEALYTEGSEYAYGSGFHRAALAATVAGVAVALLGLTTPALRLLFDGAWFSATIVAASVYYLLVRRTPAHDRDRASPHRGDRVARRAARDRGRGGRAFVLRPAGRVGERGALAA